MFVVDIIVGFSLLDRMRHRLRMGLPDAKSAHVAEALAFACGYESNAAIRAWIKGNRPDALLTARVDPDAFASRLQSLSGIATPAPASLVEMAATSSLAKVTGSDLSTVDAEVERIWGRSGFADSDKPLAQSILTGRQRLAYMHHLLNWRVVARGDGILDYVEGFAGRANGEAFHVSLAAAFQRHKDADPDMASFLVEWLMQANVLLAKLGPGWDGPDDSNEDDLNEEASADVAWGDLVYRTFNRRVDAFVNRVCLTWDNAVDPMSLQAPITSSRYAAFPRSTSPRFPGARVSVRHPVNDGSVGLRDAGVEEIAPHTLAGLACFALWQCGASISEMRRFVQRTGSRYDDVQAACDDWCSLDSGGADQLRESLDPPALEAAYFGSDMKRLNCVFVRDRDASRGLLAHRETKYGKYIGMYAEISDSLSAKVSFELPDGRVSTVVPSPDAVREYGPLISLRRGFSTGMRSDFGHYEILSLDGIILDSVVDILVEVIPFVPMLVLIGLDESERVRFRRRLDAEYPNGGPYPILDATDLAPGVFETEIDGSSPSGRT